MKRIRFDVNVKQAWTESYYDTDKGNKIEYENRNEIRGTFYDWEQVEVFANTIMIGFNNAIVEIKIIHESEEAE